MEIICGSHQLRAKHKNCVLTIGNFDGVHLGHREVLNRLKKQALSMHLPMTVMIFEPQPAEFFLGKSAPARLTRLRDKCIQLSRLGVDRLLVIKFNEAFANQTPREFVENLLVDKLGIKLLVVGDDFHFGAHRQGDFPLLQAEGKKYGFHVLDTQSYCLNNDRISSTKIRQALEVSDLEKAQTMLGRPYSISGRVMHGRCLGRTIGFPTANLSMQHLVSPVSGVYAVQVFLQSALFVDTPAEEQKTPPKQTKFYLGIANIGHRPTVNGIRQQLEVHIYDFDRDLYGKHIKVVLRHKLRDEKKFDSFARLKEQIQHDAIAAKQWLLANK